MSIAALTARVAHLEAQNRSYLSALRGVEGSYKPYDVLVATLEARVSELEARPAADTILGCTPAQFLAGMEIILRDTGKPFHEAFALWQIHAAECAEERRAAAAANASREGLRDWMAGWIAAGTPQKKALCTCGEWDCPTRELAYKEGCGFVDRCELEEELAFAAAQAELERVCAETTTELQASAAARAAEERGKAMTWADLVKAGAK